MNTTETHFILTGQNRAGALWLGQAIAQYSGITCSHGRLLEPCDRPPASPPSTLKNLMAMRRRAALLSATPLSDLLKEVHALGEGPIFGIVLGLGLSDLIGLARRGTPTSGHIFLVNLLEHPVTHVLRESRFLEEVMTYDPFLIRDLYGALCQEDGPYLDLATRADLDLCDPSVIAFMGSLLGLERVAQELDLGGITQHIRHETLIQQPNSLPDLLRLLGYDREINHRKSYPRPPAQLEIYASPEESYWKMTNWQRILLTSRIEELTMRGTYRKLGLDLSFM